MEVPEMMVSESGTAAYPRVPPRTFGYRREVLLMVTLGTIASAGVPEKDDGLVSEIPQARFISI